LLFGDFARIILIEESSPQQNQGQRKEKKKGKKFVFRREILNMMSFREASDFFVE